MYGNEFNVDIDYEPQLENDEWLKQYDIIHYHRSLGPYEQMKETNDRLRRLGIISLMDLDDYWEPGKEHPAHQMIINDKLPQKIKENIKRVNYVTTTTPIFAKEISLLNKNVIKPQNAN